jgi:hypothetical protein
MLAPFFDKMTTRDIPERFSAAEALAFFEDILSKTPANTLYRPYQVDHDGGQAYDVYDRWKNLPADFVKKWEHYREPPIPLTTTFLRWLNSYDRMAVIVPSLRLYLHNVAAFCSRIRTIFWS